MTELSNGRDLDINDAFDDIALTENHLVDASYKEGEIVGRLKGHKEGFQLGYTQGVSLGKELGSIYGSVVAQQQKPNTARVQRICQQLQAAIKSYPLTNDPNIDLIEKIEHIRALNRQLAVMCNKPTDHNTQIDYSF